MTSSEGEVVPFVKDIDPKGKNIEVWMVELNLAMCAAVRDHMIRAVRCTRHAADAVDVGLAGPGRPEWFAGPLDLGDGEGSQEKGNQGVYDYYEQIKSQLADMVVLDQNGFIPVISGRRWAVIWRSSTSMRATS